MSSATNQHDILSRLRDEIRRIERRPARRDGALPGGVAAVDAILPGGFPCGALSELRGGPASGKTAVALSLLARLGRGVLAAWIDGSGELYPPAAAAMGVDLTRLLIVRPPPGEEGARLTLWAAEVLLGSGAFAAVTIDPAPARPWRGIEPSLRRLVAAAEQGGAAGLWLSPSGGAIRPPAVVRLDLHVAGRRLVAAHAARSEALRGLAEAGEAEVGLGGAPRRGAGAARRGPGAIHAA
jgi:protein ImuA